MASHVLPAHLVVVMPGQTQQYRRIVSQRARLSPWQHLISGCHSESVSVRPPSACLKAHDLPSSMPTISILPTQGPSSMLANWVLGSKAVLLYVELSAVIALLLQGCRTILMETLSMCIAFSYHCLTLMCGH